MCTLLPDKLFLLEFMILRHFTSLTFYYPSPTIHKSNIPYAWPCSYAVMILSNGMLTLFMNITCKVKIQRLRKYFSMDLELSMWIVIWGKNFLKSIAMEGHVVE